MVAVGRLRLKFHAFATKRDRLSETLIHGADDDHAEVVMHSTQRD